MAEPGGQTEFEDEGLPLTALAVAAARAVGVGPRDSAGAAGTSHGLITARARMSAETHPSVDSQERRKGRSTGDGRNSAKA